MSKEKHIEMKACGAPENVGKILIFIIRYDLKFQNKFVRQSVFSLSLFG